MGTSRKILSKCSRLFWLSLQVSSSWTNQGLDNCGEFDSSTPTCTVDDSVSCIKTSAKAAGVKVSNHMCDVTIGGQGGMCSGQKNKCTTVGGVKQCCCDGNLCNSGTLLYGSVLLMITTLLAGLIM